MLAKRQVLETGSQGQTDKDILTGSSLGVSTQNSFPTSVHFTLPGANVPMCHFRPKSWIETPMSCHVLGILFFQRLISLSGFLPSFWCFIAPQLTWAVCATGIWKPREGWPTRRAEDGAWLTKRVGVASAFFIIAILRIHEGGPLKTTPLLMNLN